MDQMHPFVMDECLKCSDDSRRERFVRMDADFGRKKINEARKTVIAENIAIAGAK